MILGMGFPLIEGLAVLNGGHIGGREPAHEDESSGEDYFALPGWEVDMNVRYGDIAWARRPASVRRKLGALGSCWTPRWET
jgi:hypothetical protein